MADRVGIMVRGELRFLGTVAELREQMALETQSLEQLYLQLTSQRSPATLLPPHVAPSSQVPLGGA